MTDFLLSMIKNYGVIGVLIDIVIISIIFHGIGLVVHLLITREKDPEGQKLKHGNLYEKMTAEEFEKFIGDKVYRNILIPCADATTEADMVFVNKKGIFCVECKYHDKSYKPILVGSLTHDEWMVTDSIQMPNPFRQNDKHVHAIDKEIGSYTIFNVVCSSAPYIFRYFGQEYRSESTPCLYMKNEKKILMYTGDYSSYKQLKKKIGEMPDSLNDNDIERIKEYMSSHQGTEEQRKQHAERIKNKS